MHKTGPNIKISPIVSNINGPTQCISWLLSRTLGPTLRNIPAHLKNSLKLIRRIQDGDLNKNKTRPYSRSLDAVSFYTSISIQEAISNTINRIQYTTHHLSRQDITDLLDVTLQNMYFTFEDCIFCQTKGLPIGCSTSDILAILVVDKLESIVLSSHLIISPYKSYVDIYFQTTNEEKTDKFHHKEGLPVRVTHKSYMLRQALSPHPKHMHKNKLPYCNLQPVPMKKYHVPSHLQEM